MSTHLLRKAMSFKKKIFSYRLHVVSKFKSTGNEFKLSHNRLLLDCTSDEVPEFVNGCCIAKLEDTAVQATVSCNRKTKVSSFVPLQVDYQHKYSAAGRIPTNRKRREIGESEKEILISRVIDRSVRPLFPKGFPLETQIVCSPIAIDGINDPDVISINAASAALAVSDIPWDGPVGAVRVGLIEKEFIINPSRQAMSNSSLNLIIAATEHKNVVMMEGSSNQVPDDQFIKAIEAGINATQTVIKDIKEMQVQIGKPKQSLDALDVQLLPSVEMLESTSLICEAKVREIFSSYSLDKVSRGKAVEIVTKDTIDKLKENYTDCDPVILYEAINTVMKQTFRNLIFETGKRCDGRSLTDLRDISCKIDAYKTHHGYGLFKRGQTKVVCKVAFDSLEATLHNDPYLESPGEADKNFMLHYEFPPYATNEIGRLGKYGRREVGHGALAEKSLKPVMPSAYPFTIRLTSEVLSSNGSSSMASVCGGSLALMDAGVPVSSPVAGLALGLITVTNDMKTYEFDDYRLLTDIMGLEDYFGDMDFKIAGTRNGITAVQLDVKIPGLTLSMIKNSLSQATTGKNKILEIMNKTISTPRENKKSNWPILETLEIPIHKLYRLIGLGGKHLKRIRSETGVQLTQKETGVFSVFAPNSEAMSEAKEIIDELLQEGPPELEYGTIYAAKIVELRDNGVMVTLYPNMMPTLIKNSMLDHKKVRHPSALGLEVGQEIYVKYFGRDPEDGKMRLSRSALKTPVSQVVRNYSNENLFQNNPK